MKETLEESTNALLEDMKNNLIDKFFTGKLNEKSFRNAHTELRTEVFEKYDIAENEIFATVDKIIKVKEDPTNLANLNEALQYKDKAFLKAVKADIEKTDKINKNKKEDEMEATYNEIYTLIQDFKLEGKTIDDYNNVRDICGLLDVPELDFRAKELAFVNQKNMEINEQNMQILNAIIEHSMEKPENTEVDDVYYNPKEQARNSLRASNNEKEIWITKITGKVKKYAT